MHSTRFSIAIKERVCAYVNTRFNAQKQNHFGYCNPLFSNWNGINWNSKEWWRWGRIQSRFSNRRKKQNQLLCVQQKMKKKKKRKPRAYRRGKGEKQPQHSAAKIENWAKPKKWHTSKCFVFIYTISFQLNVVAECWCYSSCNSDIRVFFLSKTKTKEEIHEHTATERVFHGVQNSIHLNR